MTGRLRRRLGCSPGRWGCGSGWRPRVTIAVHVTQAMVVIDRVLYGGQDLPSALMFFNIYDSTAMGSKLKFGSGWRSALPIGGLSELVTQKS
jgi:hypothetical protein